MTFLLRILVALFAFFRRDRAKARFVQPPEIRRADHMETT